MISSFRCSSRRSVAPQDPLTKPCFATGDMRLESKPAHGPQSRTRLALVIASFGRDMRSSSQIVFVEFFIIFHDLRLRALVEA